MELKLVLQIILLIFLGVVAFYDVKKLIIPNKLILLGVLIGLLLSFINEEHTLVGAIISSGIVGGIALGISYATKGGLGMGDVKLLFTLGFYMGLWSLLNVLLISTLLSGVVGLVLLVMGKVSKKTVMPFAPFVLVSSIMLIVGGQL